MLFYTQQLLIDFRVNWRVNVTVVLRVDLSSLKKKTDKILFICTRFNEI